jgi:uncharacterized protein YyaL (SSP411 family)/thiol-disulfide isomerase/thioredoxin
VANRLMHETSPYLLQHAHNPVDWYPWGDEAFAEAKRRNVPILLSVGYSSCHWCHVMERESFDNPAVAARMNTLFVNVKVDREERPDVDELYMRAVQAFNRGQGGWPMTVFLTPEGVPFFGGTYFPPTSRAGMPGLVDVLTHVSETFHKEPEEVSQMTSQVKDLLEQSAAVATPARMLARDWLGPVAKVASDDHDRVFGGFGMAPKFPPHGTLPLLLAHHVRTGSARSLEIVTHTLDTMAKGGMYDLLGGGFCRYSVDREWRVPHFEKMLYDSAQLVPVYAETWKVTKKPLYARVVRETVGWMLREMALPGGGFAGSLDADSEGEEGSFYVFTPAELKDVLGDTDGARVATLLGVTAAGTFEHGKSVLRLEAPLEDQSEQDRALLQKAMPLLLEHRETRPRPARDDKRIVAWNALAISALARAGMALGEQDWIDRAVQSYDFLAKEAVVDGRWRRIIPPPPAQGAAQNAAQRTPAFADDHANLLGAALDLWEATFELRWLQEIETHAEALSALFWDEEAGGLSLLSKDQPQLVARSRPMTGGAEPSAAGMAALGWVRAARLLDRQSWAEKASQIARSSQSLLGRAPRSLGAEALAGAWLADGGAEIAVAGAPDAADTRALLEVVRARHLPFAVLARLPAEGADTRLPWTEGKTATGGKATGYLCEGHSCQLPTADPEVFAQQLDSFLHRTDATGAPSLGVRVHAPELPSDPAAWIGTDVPLTLAQLKGHVVVLDFWTYCCINCLHMLPELAAIEEKYASDPVVVLGVHCAKFPAEEVVDNVKRAMARHGVRHPSVHDPAHALWEEYAVRSWPTVVVIDADGRIAHQQSGEMGREELSRIIDALLAEARKEGKAATRVPVPSPAPEAGSSLRFPGKVHVWPDAFDQEMGQDPFGGNGRVYVSDTGHHRLVECSLHRGADGWPQLRKVRTFGAGAPGLLDGDAATARFQAPQGVRRHKSTLYVADTGNHALRQVDLDKGRVTTVAGTGSLGRGNEKPTREQLAAPTELALRSPWDVEVMELREHPLVFIAMAGSHQIWVYARGHVGLHTGSGREDHVDGGASVAALAQPQALSLLGRYLLFADSETSSIRAVDLQTHHVVTVVGRGLFDFGDTDGPADQVRLQHPQGLTFIGDTVFVADTFNHKIKAIGLQNGTSRTLAGGSGVLREPGGIARAGDFLLVADTNHHRLVAVHASTGRVRELNIQG